MNASWKAATSAGLPRKSSSPVSATDTSECRPSITARIPARLVRGDTATGDVFGTMTTALRSKRIVTTSPWTSSCSARGTSAPHIARWASGTSQRRASSDAPTKLAKGASRTQQLEDRSGLHVERLSEDRAPQRRSARHLVQQADPEISVVRDHHLTD